MGPFLGLDPLRPRRRRTRADTGGGGAAAAVDALAVATFFLAIGTEAPDAKCGEVINQRSKKKYSLSAKKQEPTISQVLGELDSFLYRN
jgi:hypothetical protein